MPRRVSPCRRGRWASLLLTMTFAAILTSGPVWAARKAFVVGNSKYLHTTPLPNPANDARDLGGRLKALGYEVTLGLDVGRAEFLAKFQAFAQALTKDDVALVYFAGHGLQIGGENFLFPVDANIEREADARGKLVALNSLLADLSRATRSRLVILDACRNNPFEEGIAKAQATRSSGTARGLARVYAGVGTFVAYSTQPGNVALDGDGQNSPFTAALLRHIAEPGADVHAVMRRVRGDVQRATNEQQIPWENSSLVDEIAFSGAIANGAAVSSPVPAQPPASPPKTAATSLPPGPPAAPVRPPEPFSYVSGLDAKGDNFLALRSSPTPDGVRIATMGPDTLLKVVESQGVWRRVLLSDGASGWAHSNWISCCRTMPARQTAPAAGGPAAQPALVPAAPAQPPAKATTAACDALWMSRNAIWHRRGYCFTTTRGQQAFGNAGCSRDQNTARAAMSPAERAEVDTLSAQEKQAGCQ
jgi:Caspase domain/YARHG domain/Bacterial SH3 domain